MHSDHGKPEPRRKRKFNVWCFYFACHNNPHGNPPSGWVEIKIDDLLSWLVWLFVIENLIE